jgi:hypothetical protein
MRMYAAVLPLNVRDDAWLLVTFDIVVGTFVCYRWLLTATNRLRDISREFYIPSNRLYINALLFLCTLPRFLDFILSLRKERMSTAAVLFLGFLVDLFAIRYRSYP